MLCGPTLEGWKHRLIQRAGRLIYPVIPRLPSSWEGLVVDNTYALCIA
jgi:hypothetical protein